MLQDPSPLPRGVTRPPTSDVPRAPRPPRATDPPRATAPQGAHRTPRSFRRGRTRPPAPPRSRARRWVRRLTIATAILLTLCLLAAGLLYGYVRYRASQLKTAKCPSCVVATGVSSGGIKPMNILLIGSNTRTGLDPGEAAQFGSSAQVPGARSDVTMILHLDPATGGASLLSIPRDLFVPLPAHSMSGTVGKIDAALNDGPDNLIAAINQDLSLIHI